MKHKLLHNRIWLLVLALTLLLGCPRALAAELPDLSRECSIRITLRHQGTPVPGGSLEVRQVGQIVLEDGLWQYALTEPFADFGMALDDLRDPELPHHLSAYAQWKELPGIRARIDENGTAVFSGLRPGVYLIEQYDAPEGWLALAPFLVTVPAEENGQWIYQVDASPKTEVYPEPTAPTEPTEPILPQTGQLNWPVPALAMGGILLILTGWLLYYKKEKDDYEA